MSFSCSTSATFADAVARSLQPHGFDLLGSLDIAAYNAEVGQVRKDLPIRVQKNGGEQNEDLADERSAFALVIGNSKALWRPFQMHLEGTQEQQEHPLDHYTEEHVNAAVKTACAETNVRLEEVQVYFAHHTAPGKIIAIQRAAKIANLAYLDDEISHLSIHPTYGPWISLRAMLVVSCLPPLIPAVELVMRDPIEATAKENITRLMQDAIASYSSRDNDARPPGPSPWLKVRDAVAQGCANPEQIQLHRFTEDQLQFHYKSG